MTPKHTFRILLVAAGFGVLLLVIQLDIDLAFLDGQGERESRSPETQRLIPDVEVDEIQEVRLESRERILSFERVEDGDYSIVLEDGELPARIERVRAFLESLLALDRSSSVTSDPGRHEELGVAEGTGFTRGYDYSVSLTDASGNTREMRIGLLNDSSRVLVRMANEDTVYRVQDTISFYMDQGPVFWAELRVFAGRVSLTDVESVRIERLSEGEVVRDRSYAENERAVRRILSLEADGFLRNGIDPVLWRIVLKPDNGRELVVNIGSRSRNAYPAEIVDGHDTILAVSRPTLALRADLFEMVLELLFPEVEGVP